MSQLNAVWGKNGRERKLLCEMFSLFNRFQLSSQKKEDEKVKNVHKITFALGFQC